MRGILMGALGGAGKGLAENGKAAMEEESLLRRESRAEESRLRVSREIKQMEEQARADREAAILARREKVMSTAKTPEEIERAAVLAGDEGLAKYGSGVIERNRNDERYDTEQGWKKKEYELRVDQQADTSARGWASVNAQTDRYRREDTKASQEDAKRQLYGIYLDSMASGNTKDAETARREGMREFGVDFAKLGAEKEAWQFGTTGMDMYRGNKQTGEYEIIDPRQLKKQGGTSRPGVAQQANRRPLTEIFR